MIHEARMAIRAISNVLADSYLWRQFIWKSGLHMDQALLRRSGFYGHDGLL